VRFRRIHVPPAWGGDHCMAVADFHPGFVCGLRRARHHGPGQPGLGLGVHGVAGHPFVAQAPAGQRERTAVPSWLRP